MLYCFSHKPIARFYHDFKNDCMCCKDHWLQIRSKTHLSGFALSHTYPSRLCSFPSNLRTLTASVTALKALLWKVQALKPDRRLLKAKKNWAIRRLTPNCWLWWWTSKFCFFSAFLTQQSFSIISFISFSYWFERWTGRWHLLLLSTKAVRIWCIFGGYWKISFSFSYLLCLLLCDLVLLVCVGML